MFSEEDPIFTSLSLFKVQVVIPKSKIRRKKKPWSQFKHEYSKGKATKQNQGDTTTKGSIVYKNMYWIYQPQYAL